MKNTICIHSKNNKVFDYNGNPIILICATEHYGAVMNREFNYNKYIDECNDKLQNYTRLFLLFRELQSHHNPYSTCKVETPDYISPYKRTGPGLAPDGLKKYDLDIWDDEFFERLHDFISLAEKNNIIVEVTLFSNSYLQKLFNLIPFGMGANINIDKQIKFEQFMTLQIEEVFNYQKIYVEKIVTELKEYSNIIYEICNEPGLFSKDIASLSEVNEWQNVITKIIRDTENTLGVRHLIAAGECWDLTGGEENYIVDTQYSFNNMDIDIVNIHPLHCIYYKGRKYDMGPFMSKALNIREYRQFCIDTYHEKKIVNMDEDNVASMFKDYDGWTIHRKRAWVSAMCGAHYDYIDFSVTTYCPTGSEDAKKHIHSWLRNLQKFLKHIDLEGCRPKNEIIIEKNAGVVCCVLGNKNEYHIYITKDAEIESLDYEHPVDLKLKLNLPKGKYKARLFSPETGMYSPIIPLIEQRIDIEEVSHDIAVSILSI